MTMLYLVRHGIAEEAEEGQADAERALTKRGVKEFREAARGIVAVAGDEVPKVIFTSPLLRARQTAELLARAFDGREVMVLKALEPPGDLAGFLKEVRRSKAAVAAVGHEPMLSEWAATLCFGAGGRMLLKKGGAAVIELGERKEGTLVMLVQPRVLRKL